MTKAEAPSEVGTLAVELREALGRETPVLLAAARALLRNEADARDLVQTTLEIAARKASDLRDPAALRAWLLAIQVREAFRFRRRLSPNRTPTSSPCDPPCRSSRRGRARQWCCTTWPDSLSPKWPGRWASARTQRKAT